jgi:hypothetical protein
MDDRTRDYLDRRDAEIQRQEERRRAEQERSEKEQLQLMRDRQERESQDNLRRANSNNNSYSSASGASTSVGDSTDIYRSKSLGHIGGSTYVGSGSSGCSTPCFLVIGIVWFIFYFPEIVKKEFGLLMPSDVPLLILVCVFLFWISYRSREMSMLKRIRGWICFLLGFGVVLYIGFIWYKMTRSMPIAAPRPASQNNRKDHSGSSRRHKQLNKPSLQEKPLVEGEGNISGPVNSPPDKSQN